MKLQRLSERAITVNALVYGHPGSAKTAFAATACQHTDMEDVCFVAVEGGMLTVADMGLNPLVIDADGPDEIEELFWAIKRGSEEFKSVHTVVIDSATELVAKDLEATTSRNMPKASRSGKRRSGPDDHWLEDRGEVNSRVSRIVRWYRDLGVNTIVTAHARELFPADAEGVQDRTQEPKWVEPSFGPALNRHLCGMADLVWYMEPAVDGTCVDILTQKTARYFAKTRGPRLQAEFGRVIRWPLGAPIMAYVYDTIVHGKDFALKATTKEGQ